MSMNVLMDVTDNYKEKIEMVAPMVRTVLPLTWWGVGWDGWD